MKRFTALAALGLFAAGSASAAQIVQSELFGPGTPNFSSTLTFNQFNGNLADLISVEVSLSLAVSGGNLIVDNDGADPAVVNVELGAAATLTSVDVVLLNNAFQNVVGTVSASTSDVFNLAGNVGDGVGDYDPSGPDGAILIGGNDSDSNGGFINALFFPGYVGAGTFDVTANVQQILDFGGVGGVEGAFNSVLAEGKVTVIYNYVPEPASLSLLALVGLIAARRR